MLPAFRNRVAFATLSRTNGLRGALIMHRKFKIPLENPLYHSRHVSRVTAGGATGSVLPTCRASCCAQIKVEDQCSDLSMQGGLFFLLNRLHRVGLKTFYRSSGSTGSESKQNAVKFYAFVWSYSLLSSICKIIFLCKMRFCAKSLLQINVCVLFFSSCNLLSQCNCSSTIDRVIRI